MLLVDDHPLFRGAMKAAINQVAPDVEIEEAGSFGGVRRLLAEGTPPELVLFDLALPDVEGLTGLMLLRSEHPMVPVAVVSATEDSAPVSDVLALGVQGFIPKSTPLKEIAEALATILSGEIWTPEALSLKPPSPRAQMLATLTPAQIKVLMGLRRGLPNKQMAYELGISQATVKAHLAAAFRRLGATNRTQALVAAFAMAPVEGGETAPRKTSRESRSLDGG